MSIKELATVPAHMSEVLSLAFSRDDRLLASGGADGRAYVWELDLSNEGLGFSQKLGSFQDVDDRPVHSIGVANWNWEEVVSQERNRGKITFSGDLNPVLHLFEFIHRYRNVETVEGIQRRWVDARQPISGVNAFHPKDYTYSCLRADPDGFLSQEELKEFLSLLPTCSAIAHFNSYKASMNMPSQGTAYAYGDRFFIKHCGLKECWPAGKGHVFAIGRIPTGGTIHTLFLGGSDVITLSKSDQAEEGSVLNLWLVGFAGFCKDNPILEVRNVTKAAYNPHCRIFAVLVDQTIQLFSAQTGKLFQSFEVDTDPITCLAVGPNEQLLTGHSDGSIHVWHTASKKELGVFTAHTEPVTAIEFAHKGTTHQNHFATGSIGEISLWEIDLPSLIRDHRETHLQVQNEARSLINRVRGVIDQHLEGIREDILLSNALLVRQIKEINRQIDQIQHNQNIPEETKHLELQALHEAVQRSEELKGYFPNLAGDISALQDLPQRLTDELTAILRQHVEKRLNHEDAQHRQNHPALSPSSR